MTRLKVSAAFSLVVVVTFMLERTGAVTIETVPIGNPGNAPDTRHDPMGFGSVGYDYRIGKYEVTAGQYAEFLNAVAKDDPNGLYNLAMAEPAAVTFGYGANIQRSGSPGSYAYSVAPDWAGRPVNYVSFWDAARFANWLHNGQTSGPQGPGTTEGGAYINIGDQAAFARQAGARFVIPTEDEWYKAAYHDESSGLAANYFDYPTGANSVPGTDATEATNPGNNANFYISVGVYPFGPPYFRTQVGEFELSEGPYGTFDQGGNIFEWNETVAISGSWRGARGGSWEAYGSDSLRATDRNAVPPTLESPGIGFRVASIPEPGTIALAATGLLAMLFCPRRAGGRANRNNGFRW